MAQQISAIKAGLLNLSIFMNPSYIQTHTHTHAHTRWTRRKNDQEKPQSCDKRNALIIKNMSSIEACI